MLDLDLVDIVLFLLISIVFSSQLLGIHTTAADTAGTPNTPNMLNPRGRRRPLIPLLNRHQPPREEPAMFATFYEVKPQDIVEVREILLKTRNLPIELVDMILDRAEYWVCSSTTTQAVSGGPDCINIHGARGGESQFLLRTKPLGLTKWLPSSQDLWRVEATPKQLEKEYPESDLQQLAEGPLPTLQHPFRKIVFEIESCDQGYSNHSEHHGTYRSSFTWFEAGLERFDMNNQCQPDCPDQKTKADSSDLYIPTCAIRPIWPRVVHDQPTGAGSPRYDHSLLADKSHEIQRNKHAVSQMQHHRVEWYYNDSINPESAEAKSLDEIGRGPGTGNGEFVRNLKLGDMITVWGHARFPGWMNSVKKVEVKVYWTI
ncbi:uncharacterized protein F4812DRAFT_445810 [Daldinia caldariorum]|uniref:uncharacterized protein n=1 Tax=Daldinia caldariorum TaxID=326644 RepID=UPI0020083961|nr:uncharacterized protein F4812DRAFT_445810 [Daldinia caldariorum]KAI1463612.1 hypothetical protein F4812DRAFT_445810 [Daldinia caldariorum]